MTRHLCDCGEEWGVGEPCHTAPDLEPSSDRSFLCAVSHVDTPSARANVAQGLRALADRLESGAAYVSGGLHLREIDDGNIELQSNLVVKG